MSAPHVVECLRGPAILYPDVKRLADLWTSVGFNPDKTARELAQALFLELFAEQRPNMRNTRLLAVRQGDALVASALIFDRQIRTGGQELTVLALAGVASDPARRGQGLGLAVVREALARAQQEGYPASLFQTSHKVRAFYEKLGAVVVQRPIINSLADDPARCPFWDEVIMSWPGDFTWPQGPIDLLGSGY